MTPGAPLDWETHVAVQATLLDYCRFVDEGRAEDFAALFTEDCRQEDGREPVVGRAAVLERVRKVLAHYAATSHHLSNISTAWVDAERVSATSYIYAWHRSHKGPDLEVWGRYTDVLRRVDGRWLIERRLLEAAGYRGLDKDPGFNRVPRNG